MAPSAYLISTAASTDLVHCIVPPHLCDIPFPNRDDTPVVQGSQPPTSQQRQKTWDNIKGSSIAENLLNTAPNPRARARLLASSVRESGVWLNAQPISSLGLRMDNETIRIAVGLRLGTPLCRHHTCHHCGLEVNAMATHGLSCWRSHQHAALNDIIHRSLTSAKVPSRLEPTGLQRADGKHPTELPSSHGSVESPWFGTRPTRTPLLHTTSGVPPTRREQWLAWRRAERWPSIVVCMGSAYSFTPVAIESSVVVAL